MTRQQPNRSSIDRAQAARRAFGLLLLGLSLLATTDAVAAEARESAAPKLPVAPSRAVEIRGEVVEASCYLREGKRGESHRACAMRCLANGGQLAIVEDDTGALYSLAGNTPASDPSAIARTHVANHVLVAGQLYERAGARVLVIEQIQRLD